MQLALKKDNSDNATLPQRLFSRLIKLRFVSQYSHSGIVIDGVLYHITGAHGYENVQPWQWSPEKWDITDIGGDDERAKEMFRQAAEGPKNRFKAFIWKLFKGYDWPSLLAFVGLPVRVSWIDYCFELSLTMMTGKKSTGRATPELLLAESLRMTSGKV